MLRKIKSNPYIWLTIVPLIGFLPVSSLQYCVKWDMTDAIFQWHKFISECFHSGIVPMWCPYSRLGYPFFGDPQTGLYYPVTLLFSALTDYSIYTLTIEMMLHLIAASTGMYKLLKTLGYSEKSSVTFGCIYPLTGIFISNAMHSTLLVSAAWTPWFFLSNIMIFKNPGLRSVLMAITTTSLMISGGYIALAIINIYLAAALHLYFLIKSENRARHILWGFAYAFGTLLLTFAFFASFYYCLPFIDRGNGVTLEAANGNAFSLKCFVSFLFPLLTASSDIDFGNDISMRNSYFGFLLLPFFLLYIFSHSSRSEKIIFAVSIFFIMIAMGSALPFRTLLYKFVPLMDSFRFASIFRYTAVFGFVIVLCGTYEWFINSYQNNKLLKGIASAYFAIILLSLLVALFSSENFSIAPFFNAAGWDSFYSTGIFNLTVNQVFIHLVLLAALLAFLFMRKLSSTILSILLIADIISASLLNQFSTVCLNRPVAELHSVIESYPKNFPAPDKRLISENSEVGSADMAPPVWHNAGYINKQITFNGTNSFNLKSYNRLFDDDITAHTAFPFASLNDPANVVNCTEFSPVSFSFTADCKSSDTLKIMQMNFPLWKAKVDNQEVKILDDELLRIALSPGSHKVDFSFEAGTMKTIFWVNIVLWTAFLTLGLILSSAKRF